MKSENFNAQQSIFPLNAGMLSAPVKKACVFMIVDCKSPDGLVCSHPKSTSALKRMRAVLILLETNGCHIQVFLIFKETAINSVPGYLFVLKRSTPYSSDLKPCVINRGVTAHVFIPNNITCLTVQCMQLYREYALLG